VKYTLHITRVDCRNYTNQVGVELASKDLERDASFLETWRSRSRI